VTLLVLITLGVVPIGVAAAHESQQALLELVSWATTDTRLSDDLLPTKDNQKWQIH